MLLLENNIIKSYLKNLKIEEEEETLDKILQANEESSYGQLIYIDRKNKNKKKNKPKKINNNNSPIIEHYSSNIDSSFSSTFSYLEIKK